MSQNENRAGIEEADGEENSAKLSRPKMIVVITGNRTTHRSSNPDMPGMFRSEMRISGTRFLFTASASKPLHAVRAV